MLRSKLPRSNVFLAAYMALACLMGVALVLLRGPDSLLILLQGPIIFAALFYPRRVFLPMILVAIGVSLWAITQLSSDLVSSLQSLTMISITVVAMAEIIHRLIVARIRVEAALRQSEENLLKSEARYRALSELTSDYVFADSVSPEGERITEWRAGPFSRITGYSHAEMEALGGLMALVHPDDGVIIERRAQTVLSGQTDVSEFRILTKRGEVRWLRTYTRPEWDSEHERIVRVLGAVQDVTEHKRVEEAMLHTLKLESLGVLAGGIAHDFNNLLTVIQGNAGLALLDLPADSPLRASIVQIELASQRAAELTNQMLAYSGRGHFIVQRLDLNVAIAGMVDLMKASVAKHAVLDYRLAERLPAIEADALQIRQVVMNLIVNASEALGEKPGAITITTGVIEADRAYLADAYLAPDVPPGPYVYLEVSDTGCGMDAETQAKIFDPFFTTKFTGRGLGLAAVLGIVRGHKGAIKLQSEVGQGATFRILFPAAGHSTALGLSADEDTTFDGGFSGGPRPIGRV